jgi:hypothetical protein
VLANFAVLNSIKQLDSLSDKLALITYPSSQLFFSVLNVNLNLIFSRKLPEIFLLYLMGNGLAEKEKYKNHQMIVYLL